MKARASGRQEENEKRYQSARADHCSESSAWSPMKRSRRVGEEARASRSLARSSSPPSPHGPLLGGAVGDRLVVAIVVVAGQTRCQPHGVGCTSQPLKRERRYNSGGLLPVTARSLRHLPVELYVRC